MQIKSVAILVNVNAGKGKSNDVAIWLKKQLGFKQIESEIFSEQWPSTEALDVFSDCWIIGGDGTINYFINKYKKNTIYSNLTILFTNTFFFLKVLLRKIIMTFCKEGNQIPALLRSGILCCKKNQAFEDLVFLFRSACGWLLIIKWSWWDSNPRPNIFAVNFLHAYFRIDCRVHAGTKQTNMNRS